MDAMADTTSRVLQLLGLLQSRTRWTSEELAERLEVTTRSVRRDIERLRQLGYPVRASRGAGGGYQLGPGRALPPLLLDPEEAVAVAVCLRLAAGGTVAGVGDAALRTLAKLDQVLPVRLRDRVAAVQESTVTVDRLVEEVVDPDVLLTLARACRDQVEVRLDYRSRSGERTRRRLEPYRLVALGRRWYLLAFDLDRDDWRSLRLDRMGQVAASTWRFRPREAPDPASYVTASVTRSPYRYVARVRVHLPPGALADRVPPTAGEVTDLGDGTSLLVAGGDDLRWLAVHLLLLDAPVHVLEPAELAQEMRRMGQRLLEASCSTDASASTT